MSERLQKIRVAEAESHTKTYTNHALFTPGSWLAKPVKTVLELLPLLKDYKDFRGLDLGCGVGRNCIPLAQFLHSIPCHLDCVDILPLAIEKLTENAEQFQVSHAINGIVSSIDDYSIHPGSYDFVLAISALEHVDSKETFLEKLYAIRDGLRSEGIACLIVNSSIREWDKNTGTPLPPQFEVNLSTEEMHYLLKSVFSGWEVLKHTIVHQKYDIPRSHGISALEAGVVTWVVRNH